MHCGESNYAFTFILSASTFRGNLLFRKEGLGQTLLIPFFDAGLFDDRLYLTH